MNYILTVSDKLFSLNGISYLKNYITQIKGNSIEIFNCYERTDVLLPATLYSDITLNGTVYTNIQLLQAAIVFVLYSRDNLGGDSPDVNQDNIDTVKNLTITNADTKETTLVKINNLPVYTVGDKESVWFVCTAPGAGGVPKIFKYKMLNHGKGTYGTGATQLILADLELVFSDLGTSDALKSSDLTNAGISGKNKFNKNTITADFYINTSGVLTASTGAAVSDFIPVLPSTAYYISGRTIESGSNGTRPFAVYDANQTRITVTSTFTNGTFTTGATAAYVRMNVKYANVGDVNTVQLETGTVATAYEAYVDPVLLTSKILSRFYLAKYIDTELGYKTLLEYVTAKGYVTPTDPIFSTFLSADTVINPAITSIPANLVTSRTAGGYYASLAFVGGAPVITSDATYTYINLLDTTTQKTFAIQGLNTSLNNNNIARYYTAAGAYVSSLTPAMLTAVEGGYTFTVPATATQIGMMFSNADAPGIIIQSGNKVITELVPVAKIKDSYLQNPTGSISGWSNDSQFISPENMQKILALPSGPLSYFNKGAAQKTVSSKMPGFIIDGQSQFNGRIPLASLPSNWTGSVPGAKITNADRSPTLLNWHTYGNIDFTTTAFSPELMLYRLIMNNNRAVAGHENDNIYVIKKTLGGTSIDITSGEGAGRWSADTELIPAGTEKLLVTLENRYRLAMKSKEAMYFDLKAVIELQGEGDRSAGASSRYYQNLKNKIYYTRGFTNKPNLVFLLGGINSSSTQYNATVEAAKQQLASEDPFVFYAAVANGTATLQSDVIHFNYDGGVDVATSMFNVMLAHKDLFGIL